MFTVLAHHHARRIADDYLSACYVFHDNRSCADNGIFTDHDRLAHDRPSPDMSPVAYANITQKSCAGRHMHVVADAAIVFHNGPRVHGHVDPEAGARIDDAPREELTSRTNCGPRRA